uniref:Uncharacterized protein n=1 Tax=Arundo donax TaxID=35708 RepID=A0A0A9HJF4_ARUDO
MKQLDTNYPNSDPYCFKRNSSTLKANNFKACCHNFD